MVDLEDIKRSAKVATGLDGQTIVQIPHQLWEAWLMQELRPENKRSLALLDEWEAEEANHPMSVVIDSPLNDCNQDDIDEWWDEF